MRVLIAGVLILAAVIIGLGAYLAPNDLAGCDDRPGGQTECQAADAIVAVSGGDTGARTRQAIELYHNGWAPKLIFSGAARDKSGPSNAEAMRREARTLGVPDSDIITEEYSETTKQNAERVQNLLGRHRISSVILVTSAYHQRRAMLEFTARSGGEVAVRNYPVPSDNQWSMWWWASPQGWFLAISEFIKIIVFYIGGAL